MLKKNILLLIMGIAISLVFMGCGSKSKKISLDDTKPKTSLEETKSSGDIFVHVVGEVNAPGIVKVPEGTRLYNVIEKAGGMTKNAQTDYLNLADTVKDGQQIRVISKKEYKKLKKKSHGESQKESQGGSDSSGLININTATADELQTLSGIGEVRAKAIVEYRTQNGNFSKIEDIKNVSGIGDATFNNIKSQICTD